MRDYELIRNLFDKTMAPVSLDDVVNGVLVTPKTRRLRRVHEVMVVERKPRKPDMIRYICVIR